ncbi:DUF4360 domain-containing protein [Brevundimonas aveniformis]|uniref:DUF4360 domain-containing protein n=1 Tax=Brevundimonas aveniformis TaxID=370977 RepID=UPI0024909A15|nr:DUF4360 domain-containing protein [Brevundimonas aveniformis]
MKALMISTAAVALVAAAGSAHAQSGVALGTPAYGGTGCPAGSVSAALSPDNTSLSLLFDQYVVEAGQSVGRSFDRKSCNIAIPVHVPNGYSVSVLEIDYRGYNSLPRSAQSQFNVEYFFAGRQGPRFTRTFNGAMDSDFLLNNTLVASAVTWSACGEDVILRTNSSMRVQTRGGADAMATVDSQDVNAALVYHLQWRRCR